MTVNLLISILKKGLIFVKKKCAQEAVISLFVISLFFFFFDESVILRKFQKIISDNSQTKLFELSEKKIE